MFRQGTFLCQCNNGIGNIFQSFLFHELLQEISQEPLYTNQNSKFNRYFLSFFLTSLSLDMWLSSKLAWFFFFFAKQQMRIKNRIGNNKWNLCSSFVFNSYLFIRVKVVLHHTWLRWTYMYSQIFVHRFTFFEWYVKCVVKYLLWEV